MVCSKTIPGILEERHSSPHCLTREPRLSPLYSHQEVLGEYWGRSLFHRFVQTTPSKRKSEDLDTRTFGYTSNKETPWGSFWGRSGSSCTSIFKNYHPGTSDCRDSLDTLKRLSRESGSLGVLPRNS